MSALNETPFFFQNENKRLFGVLHRPAQKDNGHGFVFCSPCFEEKLWSHRVFVSFARTLAEHGYHVLRFDFTGHGDSDGDFSHTSIESRVSDLSRAVSVLHDEIGSEGTIGLLGLRLGATVAARYAEANPGISKLVLWDPVTNGAQYVQEILLANLATQAAIHGKIQFTRERLVEQLKAGTTINVDGYELGYELYSEANQLDLSGSKSFDRPTLIVQIGRTQQKLKKDLENLCASYRRAKLVQVVEEPFWKEIKAYYARAENLFEATTSWIANEQGCQRDSA